ncbi:MAG: hypothetical protein O3B47_01460 [bacterium]|nr:hypothetical protein [bacterium]
MENQNDPFNGQVPGDVQKKSNTGKIIAAVLAVLVLGGGAYYFSSGSSLFKGFIGEKPPECEGRCIDEKSSTPPGEPEQGDYANVEEVAVPLGINECVTLKEEWDEGGWTANHRGGDISEPAICATYYQDLWYGEDDSTPAEEPVVLEVVDEEDDGEYLAQVCPWFSVSGAGEYVSCEGNGFWIEIPDNNFTVTVNSVNSESANLTFQSYTSEGQIEEFNAEIDKGYGFEINPNLTIEYLDSFYLDGSIIQMIKLSINTL